MTRHATPVNVVVREVVEVQYRKGAGVVGDPVRIAVRYYDRGGQLLAEHDTWADSAETAKDNAKDPE